MEANEFIHQVETVQRRVDQLQRDATTDAAQLARRLPEVLDELQASLKELKAAAGQGVGQPNGEEALRQSEERFRLLYEKAPLGYHSLDGDGRIIEANQAWLDMLGYPREEVVGRWLGEFLIAPDAERFAANFPRFKATGALHGVQFEMVRKDGSRLAIAVDGRVGYDERGNFKQTHCILRDITQQKLAEEALKRRNRELALYSQASQAFNSTLELDQVLALVLEETCRALEVIASSVWLSDPGTGEVVCRQATGPLRNRVRGWRLAPERGIAGWVARHNQHAIVPDALADGRYFKEVAEEMGLELRSILSVPLAIKGNAIGALQVVDTAVGRFDAGDLALLEPVAAAAAIAIDNARLYEQAQQQIAERAQVEESLRRRNRELAVLYETSLEINAQLGLSTLLRTIVARAVGLTGTHMGALYLMRPDGETLELVVSYHLPRDYTGVILRLGEGLSGRVAQSGEALAIGDHSSWEGRAAVYADSPFRRVLAVPLKVGGRVIGVINATDDEQTGEFSQDEVRLVSLFADQAAIAVENARLYEAAQRELAERMRAEAQRDATLEALRESEERYRRITEAVTDYIYTVHVEDDQHVETTHGATCVAVTGYTSEEFAANPFLWLSMVDERDRQAVLEQARRVLTGEAVGPLEHRITRKGGAQRWVRNTPVPHFDFQGKLLAYDGLIHDITERKQVEEALRESEARFRRIFDQSPIGAAIVSLDYRFTRVNEALCRIMGYSEEELTTVRFPDITHPDDLAGDLEQVRRLAAGEIDRYTTDKRYIRADGSVVWGHLSVCVMKDAAGHPLYFLPLVEEITERKRAEQEIRRQAETLTALHETALDLAAQRSLSDLLQAIVIRAANLLQAEIGSLFFYRPATDDLERMVAYNFGTRPVKMIRRRGEGLVGKVLECGRPLAIDDYNRWEGRAESLAESLAIVGMPIFWGDRLMAVLDISDRLPRTFSAGDIALLERFAPLAAAALENNRLVNDLQQQMEQLRATQTQLVQAAKLAAVGELAAGVAHELNNPLTSVLGFAELSLTNPAVGAPLHHDLEVIAREAGRARDIVRNLLDFARQTKPQRLPTDVNHVLKQTLDLIRQHIEKSGVVITEDYAPDVGLLTLDSGQIKQVFLNLITNAAQAMPKGGTLSLRTARLGDEVAISVSDTGQGIPPEIQGRIFEPFFTTKAVGEGTGLGLSVSFGIIQEHGGRISVESRVGHGSTFTVWLPTAPVR
jgi:PAS domain S-box-containing protein